MKARLSKLSVCPCGFPLLAEHITLGTLYNVHPDDTRDDLTLRCGGCGRMHRRLSMIWVEPRAGGRPGYLPASVFTLLTDDMAAES